MSAFAEYQSWLVVEISEPFGGAAVAGKLLADLGCTVARVEAAGGADAGKAEDSLDAELFEFVSRSKDSVEIDWRKPNAPEVLTTLLRAAEVLVVDRPSLRRLFDTFGTHDLHERFPELTICACTSFGLSGPMAEWAGGEAIVQAVSGIMSITGHPGTGPTRIAGAPLTHAAAMFAVTSTLADVLRKRAGGAAGVLDVSIYDAAIAFQSASLPALFLSGAPPEGIGNRHSMSVPWNTFPCSDGWVVICAGNHPNWVRLCETIGRPDLLLDPRYATQEDRIAGVEEIEAHIADWTSKRTVAEVEELLERNTIAGGSILPLQEVLNHPQFKARNLIDTSSGERQAGAVFHLQREPLEVRHGRWKRGTATRSVLLGRGLVDPDTYARWSAMGVILEGQGALIVEPA